MHSICSITHPYFSVKFRAAKNLKTTSDKRWFEKRCLRLYYSLSIAIRLLLFNTFRCWSWRSCGYSLFFVSLYWSLPILVVHHTISVYGLA